MWPVAFLPVTSSLRAAFSVTSGILRAVRPPRASSRPSKCNELLCSGSKSQVHQCPGTFCLELWTCLCISAFGHVSQDETWFLFNCVTVCFPFWRDFKLQLGFHLNTLCLNLSVFFPLDISCVWGFLHLLNFLRICKSVSFLFHMSSHGSAFAGCPARFWKDVNYHLQLVLICTCTCLKQTQHVITPKSFHMCQRWDEPKLYLGYHSPTVILCNSANLPG